eukprot:PhM_4_TR676/c0_g1_i1/m.78877
MSREAFLKLADHKALCTVASFLGGAAAKGMPVASSSSSDSSSRRIPDAVPSERARLYGRAVDGLLADKPLTCRTQLQFVPETDVGLYHRRLNVVHREATLRAGAHVRALVTAVAPEECSVSLSRRDDAWDAARVAFQVKTVEEAQNVYLAMLYEQHGLEGVCMFLEGSGSSSSEDNDESKKGD